MGPPYDAIVIGAGLGGLTAAALLARAGRRTLIIERNESVGGAASTYKVGDLSIEGRQHGARVAVKTILRPGVTDFANRVARDARIVDHGIRGNLARNDDQTGGHKGLTGNARRRIDTQCGIEDCV